MNALRPALLSLFLMSFLTLQAQEPVPPPLPVDSTGELKPVLPDSISIPLPPGKSYRKPTIPATGPVKAPG